MQNKYFKYFVQPFAYIVSRVSSSDFLFFFFFFLYTFVDMIRRFFFGSKLLVLSLDVVVITLFFVFIFIKNRGRIPWVDKIDKKLLLMLIPWICFLVLQLLNLRWTGPLITLMGFRSYLLPFVFLLIGIDFAFWAEDRKKVFMQFLITLSVLSCMYGIFLFFADTSKAVGLSLYLFSSLEHGSRSFGTETLELVSSFFASSKRFARFLMITYLLSFGLIRSQKMRILLGLFFLIGIFISGARESFVLMLIFLLFYISRYYFIKILIFSMVVIILFSTFSIKKAGDKDDQVQLILKRIVYTMSSPEDYTKRISMFFPIIKIKDTHAISMFGYGMGSYGQEADFDFFVNKRTESYAHEYFITPGRNWDYFSDPGLTKILIELGWVGIVLFLTTYLFLFFRALIVLPSLFIEEKWELFALNYIVIIWVILFLKSHNAISDIGLTSMLWFSIGRAEGMRRENFPAELSQKY